MNTFKSFPNTLPQLYSWWWLRSRSSTTTKHSDQRCHSPLTSELQPNQYCPKCQQCTGVAATAGHRHRLKDTGQCEGQHCQHNHHQSSSSTFSYPSSSVSVLSPADHQHTCNMCQHRPNIISSTKSAAQSTCRANRRKSSTYLVLFHLLLQLLLVSLSHGNYSPFCVFI